MNRYAILDSNNVVINVTVMSEEQAANISSAVLGPTANIGETYYEGVFTSPEVSAKVPHQVTRRQARQALFLAGILPNVQAAIDAIPDTTERGMVQIEWDDSLNFERNRPTLIALATALGLSSQDLDNLFLTAVTL